MIAYLQGDVLDPPVAVTTATAPEGETATGLVTSTIVHGDLFLHPKGEPGTRYRLRWSPDHAEPARPLPVGTYLVTGYRHQQTAEDGTPWIWSTTSRNFREIEVAAGETTHCPVQTGIAVGVRAFEKRGSRRVALAFRAEKGLGHTLYRDGRRIGIRWQCLDATGEVLAEGPMRYG